MYFQISLSLDMQDFLLFSYVGFKSPTVID